MSERVETVKGSELGLGDRVKLERVETVKGSELGLGDRVKLGEWPHSTATVVQISADEIRMIRPYVHTGDFSYSGNQVPWYLGVEDFKVSISKTFTRIYKCGPLK